MIDAPCAIHIHHPLHRLRGFDDVTHLLSGDLKRSDPGSGPENRTTPQVPTDTDSSEEFGPMHAFRVTTN